MKVAKVNFGESIGSGSDFWGTTLQEIRYLVEGYAAFDSSLTPQYPEVVELHFWKCYGGEVFEGYAIYNYLRDLVKQGVKVISYSHGLTASIAVLIFLAADERYADHASQAFTHKPICDLGCYANSDDMREAADSLDKIQLQIAEVYVARAGITMEQANNYLNSNAWQTADEMVASGFATAKSTDVLVAPAGAEKVLNFLKLPIKPQNMAITPAEETNIVNKVVDAVKALFKNNAPEPATPAAAPAPEAKNLAVTLAEEKGTVYVDAAGDDIAQGDMVYSDADMTTAAADDTYALADGRSITVVAGAITSVTEAANVVENNAALEAAEKRATDAERELAIVNNKLKLAQNKLASVPGSTGNPTPAGATGTVNKSVGGAKNSGSLFAVTKI
ncbi:ATP-dependent Clp protease proteolytic subunit [Hymenobacter fodinae]|uniref:ATP-dependent Clp protease proteolytic subunit n=1 Tax=Hymenobacter fodinae TaxID=2510796 RepID=A0A4Z0P8R3_9BACT|nr:ATP-dependent Clp protease proteolytic subunit [Hymenobacter fodinae]TGE08753.1 hypothetical protein EU556_13790 [Hymenobacter fodinae]